MARKIKRYRAYDDEWLISCGTCIHVTGRALNYCKDHRLCLLPGVPDEKLLNAGYEHDMNFRYKLWETRYPRRPVIELEPELFEI